MSPSVLVVTVTYNSADTIRPFLDSLAEAGHADEVIAVDNASTEAEEVGELVRAAGHRFVELDRNAGYGGGVRAAVEAASTAPDYILVANPDVVFAPGALDALVAAGEQEPGAGSLGPKILEADGRIYPSARRLPSLRTGVAHALFGRIWPGNPWTVKYRAERETETRRDAGWLSGACLLLRASAYRDVDGFDTGYFMYFEDVDLGDRLGRAGWRNVYVPEAVVTHTGAHSTSRARRAMEKAHHDSAYRYLSRRYSAWYFAPLRLAIQLGLWGRLWWVSR
ncbi:glycosyltransferase family 2 protein [Leifsonia sp. F6_8S_P_1B]|uniref:Glycosyltransferase family 2 protein n=1 Tax=Leifsonia williamsii TaxID=3035919 RepID=A0ABT8KAE6_9MICO|nr:glycosyltransferase family 2 protein [Leifsonia williamsii]MDN4614418.1 glycosyltransferase family 2 protein [Leifsonia williamsii]